MKINVFWCEKRSGLTELGVTLHIPTNRQTLGDTGENRSLISLPLLCLLKSVKLLALVLQLKTNSQQS